MSKEPTWEDIGRATPELIEKYLEEAGWSPQERHVAMTETVLDHGSRRASLDTWARDLRGEIAEVLAPTPGRPFSWASQARAVGGLAALEGRSIRKTLENILERGTKKK